MTVSLHDAVVALDKRKQATLDKRKQAIAVKDAQRAAVDSDESRFMVLGFDVTIQDLFAHGRHVGRFTEKHVASVAKAAEAAWMDGVLTGLMLAELRRGERVA